MFSQILIPKSTKKTEGERVHHFEIEGIGKSNHPTPFAVPNEYICANLGAYIGLPIPPFCIARDERGKYYFVSLSVDRNVFQEAAPAILACNEPEVASGVVLFDIFILNGDRKLSQGRIDSVLYNQNTRQVVILDHSHALFGYERGRDANGIRNSGTHQRLDKYQDELGIDDPKPHGLVEHITTKKFFEKWYERIRKISDELISEVVRNAQVLADADYHHLSDDEIDFCIQFLIKRKRRIHQLVKKHRNRFLKIA